MSMLLYHSEQNLLVDLPIRQYPISPGIVPEAVYPLTEFLRAATRLLQGTTAMTKTTSCSISHCSISYAFSQP